MAKDTLKIVLHSQVLYEDKNVAYEFVCSKQALNGPVAPLG